MTRVGTPRRVETPWRVVTSLCLIFSLIDLSKENCADYVNLTTWKGTDLIRTIPLAQNKDPKDLLYCTMKLACNPNTDDKLCHILNGCLERNEKTTCEGPSSRNISFYHLMCLVAKLQNYPPNGVAPEGCEYENVCELYPQISADQTTTTTTTTTTAAPITESTTATSPTTVLSPTTTPAPPPTPPPPLTPALPPTPGTTTVKHDGGNANSSTGTRDASNMLHMSLLIMLIISGTLNVVQAVFFCKRWRTQHRTPNPTHQDESCMLNETCNDPDVPLMPMITKPDRPHVDSPSADTTRNRGTAGNGSESH